MEQQARLFNPGASGVPGAAFMDTPRHRPAPGEASTMPALPTSSQVTIAGLVTPEIKQSLENLSAITAAYDAASASASVSASARPSRPSSALATPRAPTSARKFVYVRGSPKQSFVVQKAASDHNRPSREMGVSSVKLPYSQPWYRPQLEETLDELERSKREISRLKEVVASIAKERDAAFAASQRSADMIIQKSEENKQLQSRIDAAEEEAARERFFTETVRKEREETLKESTKLKARIATLSAELDDLKSSMSQYLEERVKAERSSAEAAVTAAQAQAQARLAIQQREDVAKERDAARRLASAAEKAETERIRERRAAAERVEQERKARLEAKIISVPSESKEFLYNKLAEVVNFSEEQARFASERYNDPSYIWSFLESKNYDGQHDAPIVLLSAAWLRTQRPTKLPDRSKLPPEALIPVRSLRAIHSTIDKGMAKGMSRPMPIICVLHGGMRLDRAGGTHPDPEGEMLETVVKALDARWGEYTRRRGGTQSTGVTDMGVFIEWSSIHMQPIEEGKVVRKRTAHEEKVFSDALSSLGTLFSHKLTTVWMMQPKEGEAPETALPSELRYRSAWPEYLRLVANVIKPNNLNDTNAWPQLLKLGKDLDGVQYGRAEQEKISRGAPPEPLIFAPGHRLDALDGMNDTIRDEMPELMYGLLAGTEDLDFRRCGWGDEEASWLAVVLPMCGCLKRLQLSSNSIGNLGASALAGALSTANMATLELLALDNNEIGDAGASALFQRMANEELSQASGNPDVLSNLKTFTLSNNEINDASVTAISGAIAGGALRGCKKVDLVGNPASKATVKLVKKALKKKGR